MNAQNNRLQAGSCSADDRTPAFLRGELDPQRSHIWYFDWLRLFAMLAVIFMHAASGFLRGQITRGWHAANLLTSISFTAVPLFFMMSGALLLSDERTPDVKLLLRRRMPRILLPLFFYSIIAVLWLWYRDGPTGRPMIPALLMGLNKPVYVHLWFLYTLAGLYLISPFLYRMVYALDAKLERYLLLLLGAVVLLDLLRAFAPAAWRPYFQWRITEDLKLFGGHLFAFLLGYYLHRARRKISTGVLLAAALVIWATIAAGTYCQYHRTGELDSGFMSQNGGWELLLAACLFLTAKQTLNHPRRKPELPGVALAMPIYLSHNLILSYLNWRFLRPDRFLEVAAIWALTATISLVVSKTLTTVPGLCYLSSGMSFQKACANANWIAAIRELKRKNGR